MLIFFFHLLLGDLSKKSRNKVCGHVFVVFFASDKDTFIMDSAKLRDKPEIPE